MVRLTALTEILVEGPSGTAVHGSKLPGGVAVTSYLRFHSCNITLEINGFEYHNFASSLANADIWHLYTEIRDTARSMRFKELFLEHVIVSRADRYIVAGLRRCRRY